MPNSSISPPSPNSPPDSPANAFPLWATLAAVVGLVFVYVATAALLVRIFHISGQSVREAQLTLPMIAVQILSYIPVIAYLSYVLPVLAGRKLSTLFVPVGTREILAGVWGSLLMWGAVTSASAVQTLVSHHTPHQLAVRLFENVPHGLLLDLMIFIAVVLAPFTEELVFRGFIFNALRSRLPLWSAIVASGLIFGLAHGETLGVLPLAAGGIVLAAIYARSGSLWSSTIAHGIFNSITLLLLFSLGKKA